MAESAGSIRTRWLQTLLLLDPGGLATILSPFVRGAGSADYGVGQTASILPALGAG